MKKKKILYLHQYFATDKSSTGTRSYEISKELMLNNYDVTVITSSVNSSSYLDKKQEKLVEFSNYEGINIVSIKTSYSQNATFVNRIISFLLYAVLTSIFCSITRKYDYIYATSTPLTIGIPALVSKLLRRKKLIFEVRDLWPDIPIQMGVIKNKYLLKVLNNFESFLYYKADKIIVLSKGMKNHIEQKYPELKLKIEVVPNFSNNRLFNPNKKKQKLDFQKGISFIHSGTIGLVNDVSFILDIAEYFQNNLEYKTFFYILGEGNQKEALIRKKEEKQLKNVYFLNSVPKYKLSEIIDNIDICIMTVGKVKLFETNSANKFFDYLAMGKPIVLNYGGWMQETIESHNCGISIGRSVENLKLFLEHLRENPSEYLQMSANSKELATEEFDKDILTRKIVSIINGV